MTDQEKRDADEAMLREAVRTLFAPRSSTLFADRGTPGPDPRIVVTTRSSDQTRETARNLFASKPPTSSLEARMRGIDPKETDS